MSGLDIERLRIELIPEEEPSPKVLNRWCGGISYCYTCKKEVFVDVNSLQVGLKLHPNWC